MCFFFPICRPIYPPYCRTIAALPPRPIASLQPLYCRPDFSHCTDEDGEERPLEDHRPEACVPVRARVREVAQHEEAQAQPAPAMALPRLAGRCVAVRRLVRRALNGFAAAVSW